MALVRLAIDCSSELCSVALSVDGQLSYKEKHSPREHAYLVLPFAEGLLQENALHFSDVDEFIFAQGPGAFTGLRVAASAAQGLAIAYDKPIYAFSSLHALALQLENNMSLAQGDIVYAVLDARMSELYWACFEKSQSGLVLCGQESLGSVESLIAQLKSEAYFIGPGCRHLQDSLSQKNCLNFGELARFSEIFPHAREQLLLARGNHTTNKQSKDVPFPVYLRNHVADKPSKNS